MKESINAAVGAAMESIAASPVAREHIGGTIGKAVRSGLAAGAFICAGLMSVATSAQAADNSINGGCMLGAIAGGLLGNQVGGGNGRKVATAAGAVMGCKSGQDVQANSEYRQQRPAGYDNRGYNNNRGYDNRGYDNRRPQQARYEEPVRDLGQYGNGQDYGQQSMSANPMQSYMPHAFAQIDGRESPSQSLTTQGRMAMDKALAEAENRMRENIQAQQVYAQLYDQRSNAIGQSMNPEAEALVGGGALRNNTYQVEQQLNRAAQVRSNANANFGSAGMRAANLAEYEAAQGYDVRPYADRIMRILNAPMSAPVSGINSTTRQHVTFATPSAMRAGR